MVRGRGVPPSASPTGHGGTSIGVVILSSAILLFVVGLAVYAVVGGRRADRREAARAESAGEPTRLPGAASEQTEPGQGRKAA